MNWHQRREAPPDDATLDWVRRSIDPASSVRGAEFLPGGSFSAIHRVRLRQARKETEVVVRRWLDPDWQRNDPDLNPGHEAAALRIAERHQLPAPRLLALDPAGDEVGVPTLVMSSLPGTAGAVGVTDDPGPPLAQGLARTLAAIHRVPRGASEVLPEFGFYNDARALTMPRLSQDEGLWREALTLAQQPRPAPPATLVHRDFNPGNVLRQGDRITGVVDWGAACWGPPNADIAHARWNLAVTHGPSTADAFLVAYQREVPGFAYDPYWDVRAVFDLLPETAIHFLDAQAVARIETYLRANVLR